MCGYKPTPHHFYTKIKVEEQLMIRWSSSAALYANNVIYGYPKMYYSRHTFFCLSNRTELFHESSASKTSFLRSQVIYTKYTADQIKESTTIPTLITLKNRAEKYPTAIVYFLSKK